MNWAILIPIIAQYGIPLAEKIWLTWQSNKGEPTQSEWDALKALANQTARSQLEDSLRRAGVALDSDRAKELLGLLG